MSLTQPLAPQQHRFLSTGTNLKSSSFHFDGVTPNKYEETTDNDNAYTYSMYTETIMGRSDLQSKAARSR